VRPAHIRAAVKFLEGKGFDVVIVGGAVMQLRGSGSTEDVDLFVTVSDYGRLEEVLLHDTSVVDVKLGDETSVAYLKLGGEKIRIDILDPSYFSGEKTGDEFFDYVKRHWSKEETVGRVADPAVVWYTRLFVKKEAYLDRIDIDLGQGAKIEWLDGAQEIANYLGTKERIREQLRRLDELFKVTRGPD
jgi:hypothetical protein